MTEKRASVQQYDIDGKRLGGLDRFLTIKQAKNFASVNAGWGRFQVLKIGKKKILFKPNFSRIKSIPQSELKRAVAKVKKDNKMR